MNMDSMWTGELELPDSFPEEFKSKMRERHARRVEINDRANAIFDAQGWERVDAWATRLADSDATLNLIVNMGWLTGASSSVADILDHYAQEYLQAGDDDSAVVFRLLAISARSTGLSPTRISPIIETVDGLIRRTEFPLPTHEEWEHANVDALLRSTELDAAEAGLGEALDL